MYWVYSMCLSLSHKCIRNDTWNGCKAKQIALGTKDCVGCKICESACTTDFLSIQVYLWHEKTGSMGITH